MERFKNKFKEFEFNTLFYWVPVQVNEYGDGVTFIWLFFCLKKAFFSVILYDFGFLLNNKFSCC